jgi:hypothetical protein
MPLIHGIGITTRDVDGWAAFRAEAVPANLDGYNSIADLDRLDFGLRYNYRNHWVHAYNHNYHPSTTSKIRACIARRLHADRLLLFE